MTNARHAILADLQRNSDFVLPTLGGKPLSAVRFERETEDCLFVYQGGATRSLWGGCADHGITMFVDASTDEVLGFARVSSDTAFELGLSMYDDRALAAVGLKVVQRIQDLPAAIRADCIGRTVDVVAMEQARACMERGRKPYVHPSVKARLREPVASRVSLMATKLAAGL